jgi:LemA protein
MIGIEWIIALVVLVVLIIVGMIIYYKNKIIGTYNRVKNAWAQIDVQLKKRADLVPNLVETVKGYAKHEKGVFENVTKARSAMLGAQGVEDKAKANNMLTGALKSLFAVAENYPELKASENFKLLQEQLDGIESKIAYARQFYNDAVLEFNNTIQMIPARWFAGGRKAEQFFEIAEAEKAVPKVKFE